MNTFQPETTWAPDRQQVDTQEQNFEMDSRLGSLADIVVPGRTLVGSVRKASSVCSSHVMPNAVIA
jgi:hypothetical protein